MEIACIVEGEGEEAALPTLIDRIIREYCSGFWARAFIATNFHGRDKFQDEAAVRRAVDSAARRVGSGGAVLILRDADDDCPVEEAQRLHEWARSARSDVHISVVIAKREYEAWFIAAAESLRGFRGVRPDLQTPDAAETIGNAKGWLTLNMVRNQPYSPTAHQKAFSQRMDLLLARVRSSSFDKLCRDVLWLVDAIRRPEA
ncbi:MAG: DUF4276 family protein [Chloroflexota bacterium]